MPDLNKLSQLRQRAREIWVDNPPGPEVDEGTLALRIAEREAELLASNNALYLPAGAPGECYAQLYDPTAEDEYKGILIRPCVICEYARRCGAVIRARFGRAPGDPMPPPDGADPMPERTSPPPGTKRPTAKTKPKETKPMPPLALRPKDPRTGLIADTKINTTALLLLDGSYTKQELIEKVIEKHGGTVESNKNTVSTAIWMFKYRNERYPLLGPLLDMDEDGRMHFQGPRQ